jgi:hypothetical protein
LVFQIVDFSSVNDLKFTYVHLQFQNFFPGVIPPDPHDEGEGRAREMRGRKGRGGEGREGRGGEGGEGKEGRGGEAREGRDGMG